MFSVKIKKSFITILAFYLCTLLFSCSSSKTPKKYVQLGKSTFDEQLHVDINTCIAYLVNIKTANSIEEQILNTETSASIYRKIKPIYNYINDNFTFVSFEDETLSNAYEELEILLGNNPIIQDLVTKKTNEILEKLLTFKEFASIYKIKKEDYALIVNHILHEIKKDLKYFKATEGITEKRLYSYLTYEKLSIYLSTFKTGFNKKSIYIAWDKSIRNSIENSHPRRRQDSTQIIALRLQIANQKNLLLKTAADWDAKYSDVRYTKTFFEDKD